MKYNVYKHYYGRRIVMRGPMQGCLGFPNHEHEKINNLPVSLERAKEMADAAECHAQVVSLGTATLAAVTVYENDKAPGLRDGMVR